jgi:hypothetical protein
MPALRTRMAVKRILPQHLDCQLIDSAIFIGEVRPSESFYLDLIESHASLVLMRFEPIIRRFDPNAMIDAS